MAVETSAVLLAVFVDATILIDFLLDDFECGFTSVVHKWVPWWLRREGMRNSLGKVPVFGKYSYTITSYPNLRAASSHSSFVLYPVLLIKAPVS